MNLDVQRSLDEGANDVCEGTPGFIAFAVFSIFWESSRRVTRASLFGYPSRRDQCCSWEGTYQVGRTARRG
jgi:hypothetical protein